MESKTMRGAKGGRTWIGALGVITLALSGCATSGDSNPPPQTRVGVEPQSYSIGGTNYADPRLLRTIRSGDACVWALAFSPDGRYLATGSESGLIRVWECASLTDLDPRPAQTLDSHTNRVFDLDFTSDGTRLISSGRDGNVIVWDIDTGKMIHVLAHSWEIRATAISPDDSTVVTGQLGGTRGIQSPTVFIWDLNTGEPIQTLTHLAPCTDIDFSPDGVLFALGFIDGEPSMLVDSETRRDVLALGKPGIWANSIRFDPSGSRLALATVRSPLDTRTIGKIQFWNARTGDELEPIEPESGPVGLDFTPNGEFLAASLPDDKKIVIWSMKTQQEIAELPGTATTAIQFSPDGRLLAGCSPREGVFELWVFGDESASIQPAGHDDHD